MPIKDFNCEALRARILFAVLRSNMTPPDIRIAEITARDFAGFSNSYAMSRLTLRQEPPSTQVEVDYGVDISIRLMLIVNGDRLPTIKSDTLHFFWL